MEGINAWLVGGGLAVGAIFGLLIQYQRFCMVAATGNLFLIGDKRQVLAFLAALIVAIAGTQFSNEQVLAQLEGLLMMNVDGSPVRVLEPEPVAA